MADISTVRISVRWSAKYRYTSERCQKIGHDRSMSHLSEFTIHDHHCNILCSWYSVNEKRSNYANQRHAKKETEQGSKTETLRERKKYRRRFDMGHPVVTLRYKPKGCGFDSHAVIGIFHWHYPSGRTMTLGSTPPLTERSPRGNEWGGGG
jgi:hypothetical protein